MVQLLLSLLRMKSAAIVYISAGGKQWVTSSLFGYRIVEIECHPMLGQFVGWVAGWAMVDQRMLPVVTFATEQQQITPTKGLVIDAPSPFVLACDTASAPVEFYFNKEQLTAFDMQQSLLPATCVGRFIHEDQSFPAVLMDELAELMEVAAL